MNPLLLAPSFQFHASGFQRILSLFLLKQVSSALMSIDTSYYGSWWRKGTQFPTRSWWNWSRVSADSFVKFEAFPLQRLRNNPSKKYSLFYPYCLFLLGTAAVASQNQGDKQHCQLDQRLFQLSKEQEKKVFFKISWSINLNLFYSLFFPTAFSLNHWPTEVLETNSSPRVIKHWKGLPRAAQ